MKNGLLAGQVGTLDFDYYYYYYYEPNHWELQTVQSVSQLFTQKLCFTIEKQSNSILKSELAKALQVHAGMVFSDPIKNGLLEPL